MKRAGERQFDIHDYLRLMALDPSWQEHVLLAFRNRLHPGNGRTRAAIRSWLAIMNETGVAHGYDLTIALASPSECDLWLSGAEQAGWLRRTCFMPTHVQKRLFTEPMPELPQYWMWTTICDGVQMPAACRPLAVFGGFDRCFNCRWEDCIARS